SKLIHGGVRYLQQGDIGLVREAASERARIHRIAPHLAVPLLMVMPTYGRATHLKLGAGLWAFEKIAAGDAAERHAMGGRGDAPASRASRATGCTAPPPSSSTSPTTPGSCSPRWPAPRRRAPCARTTPR